MKIIGLTLAIALITLGQSFAQKKKLIDKNATPETKALFTDRCINCLTFSDPFRHATQWVWQ
jgi:hypothetical protein